MKRTLAFITPRVLLLIAALMLFTACNQTGNNETGISKSSSKTDNRYEDLANIPIVNGYPTKEGIKKLEDEIFFQRATQVYLWALPAINIYAVKEGVERDWGKGYNIFPTYKDRFSARTQAATPNSDVIYGSSFFDLKENGPIVIELQPGLQGLINDSWQRPIASEGKIDGKEWSGDVGLPGPDKGKGGKYLILPPDYKGKVPAGYYTFRSGTYGAFILCRAFYKDPKDLDASVKSLEKTIVYPLGKKESAKPMQFPNGSEGDHDFLYPKGIKAFEMISRFINSEYVDPADMEMRGVLKSIGIEKGKPFNPTPAQKDLLEKAGNTAYEMVRVIAFTLPERVKEALWYNDRKWINLFPSNATFTEDTYTDVDSRTAWFAYASCTSPGMAIKIENAGAKYPTAFVDSKGDFLSGSNNYKLHLPKDIPAAIFWSVTVYNSITASGLDNGQPFPAINTMDKPFINSDGSIDIYFGPKSPGKDKNWIETVENQGFFVMLRLYGPEKAFFDQTWKPGDIEKIK